MQTESDLHACIRELPKGGPRSLHEIRALLLLPEIVKDNVFEILLGGTTQEVAHFLFLAMNERLGHRVDLARVEFATLQYDIQALQVQTELTTMETHYGYHSIMARWWIFEGSEEFECIMAGRFNDLIKDAPYEGSESLPLIGLKRHWDAAVANLLSKVKG